MTKEIEVEGFGAFAEALEGIYNRPAIPDTTGATTGDVLTLGSDGPEWAEVPKELPDTTGATTGDVLSLGASGPEWATPAGGGGGAFIDTANLITSGTVNGYETLSYTATQDCCVTFMINPVSGYTTYIKIDNVTVKSFYGNFGNNAGLGYEDCMFLKAGQTLTANNNANYPGSYHVYGLK